MGIYYNGMRALDLSGKANFPQIPFLTRNQHGLYNLRDLMLYDGAVI